MIQIINKKIISIFAFDLREFLREGLILNIFSIIISISVSLIIFFTVGFSRGTLGLVILSFVLAFESVYDLLYKEIQVGVIVFAFVFKLAEGIIYWDHDIFIQILLGLLVFGIVLIISKISRGGIGGGDAMAFMCLISYLGIKHSILIILIALLLMIIISVVLLITKKCSVKASLPFIPFLYTSYFLFILGASI